MKLVCINNIRLNQLELTVNSYYSKPGKILALTPGKIYNAEPAGFFHLPDFINEDDNSNTTKILYYIVVDDNAEMVVYPENHFVTQDAWREMQLIKLFDK